MAWFFVNGNEIHDRETKYNENGARIGDTPNLIATIEEAPFWNSSQHGRLIASAPDLLAALKLMVSFAQSVNRAHPEEVWLGSEYNQALTALRKAGEDTL